MVRKLFNDLVTTLDILPTSTTVNLCVHHPSPCVLTGKVRIIAKRPCVYKSLVLTVTGTSRILVRQGPKTMKGKQVFLQASKEVIHNPTSSSSTTSSSASRQSDNRLSIVSTTAAPILLQTGSVSAQEESGQDPGDSSPITHSHHQTLSGRHSTSLELERSASVAATSIAPPPPTPQTHQDPPAQNQLHAGVNDIDFRIEFPSHTHSDDNPPPTAADMYHTSLPSGPIKTASGDSSIKYILSATLVMSRRDILVNNHVSASVPFRVQGWQDAIDWNQGEDHTYHGKRRGKIEFQFQVPKQLDMHRLHDLQFGFQASWRTLEDNLKVKEMQYYIIEEEHQTYASNQPPQIIANIISTAGTYDCSANSVSTNTWDYFRNVDRLQIPQPNTVMETMTTPAPNHLAVSHKLRIIVRFDQTVSKERDLQLSFPILIHPTLDDDGSPVHPGLMSGRRGRRYRRRERALYGMSNRDHYDDDEDEDMQPLPVYGDREDSLLLMSGHEVQESDFLAHHIDALGITMSMVFPEQGAIHSPSDASMSSSPISMTMPSPPFTSSYTNAPTQEEHHRWSVSNRSASLTPASPDHPDSVTSEPRRHSSVVRATDWHLPPPYGFPPLIEEPAAPPAHLGSITTQNESTTEPARLSSSLSSGTSFESQQTPVEDTPSSSSASNGSNHIHCHQGNEEDQGVQ
ncbi:hypothetical protein BG011_006059 [Mortierella polycephala]|uniref:Uncharacterized protein n=1 Tax=Mortierella polycephala TaxID=41804 RepID=A0A9P6U868_9FUNG|nr:hypothetical protein BG011_006059 [Mortierella polycephala]